MASMFSEFNGEMAKEVLSGIDFFLDKNDDLFPMTVRGKEIKRYVFAWEAAARLWANLLHTEVLSATIIWDEEVETVYFPNVPENMPTVFFSDSGKVFQSTVAEIKWLVTRV